MCLYPGRGRAARDSPHLLLTSVPCLAMKELCWEDKLGSFVAQYILDPQGLDQRNYIHQVQALVWFSSVLQNGSCLCSLWGGRAAQAFCFFRLTKERERETSHARCTNPAQRVINGLIKKSVIVYKYRRGGKRFSSSGLGHQIRFSHGGSTSRYLKSCEFIMSFQIC